MSLSATLASRLDAGGKLTDRPCWHPSAVQQFSAAAHRYLPRARLLEPAWPAPQ